MRLLRATLLWLLLLGIVAALIWFSARPPTFPNPEPARTPTPVSPSATPSPQLNAVITWISDGDTLDAIFEGERTKVRLLNIDAPELGHDGKKDQCLATAARDLLASLLPLGGRARVIPYGRDRFGRFLAGIYLADGRLVNAELVRQGLAAPLVVAGNVRLLRPIREARAEADAAGVGLHADTGCSIPGRVAAAKSALAALPRKPTASAKERVRAKAATILRRLRGIERELSADARDALVQALPEARQEALLLLTRTLIAQALIRSR